MEFNSGNSSTSEAELFRAQSHLWNHSLSYIHSMSLRCAIQLGIPDLIHGHGRPMTLPELVSALSIHPSKTSFLHRLMRILIRSGFFAWEKISAQSEGEGYVLTLPSGLLLKGNQSNISPFMLLKTDPIMVESFYCLSKWLSSNDIPAAFAKRHGKSFWDNTSHDPEANRAMNEAMASDTSVVAGVLINKFRGMFEHARTLVDVGGGTGALARALAREFPHKECTVLDRPHVVGGLEGDRNLGFMDGDMFQTIPPTDILLLKWILHDWSDEKSVEILRRCKEAIRRNGNVGKLILIEMVLIENKEEGDEDASIETKLLLDMLMMVLVAGKERSEKELARLFLDAGFTNYKITPLDCIRSVIEVYP